MWNTCLVGSEGHNVHTTGIVARVKLLWIILRSHWHDWPVLWHWLSHCWHWHLVRRVGISNHSRDKVVVVVFSLIVVLGLHRVVLRRWSLMRDDRWSSRVLWISVWKRLNLSPASSHCLVLLDLQDATGVDWSDVTPLSLTVLLVLFVDVQKQLFNLVAGCHVLWIESWTDAKMERFFRFFLLWTFFESWALASKSQFDDFLRLRHVLAALLDDPFHVAAFCTNQTSSHLELFVVRDLNVVSASILGLPITVEIRGIPLDTLRILLLLRNEVGRAVVLVVIARASWNKWVLILSCRVDALNLKHRAKRGVLRKATWVCLRHQGWARNSLWLGRLEARLIDTHLSTTVTNSFLVSCQIGFLLFSLCTWVFEFLILEPFDRQHDVVLRDVEPT